MRDVVIIGAGPAGLFAGISCTTMGRNVTIIEKTSSPGKKLLLSGGGQCNLTNAEPASAMLKRYFGAGRFLKPSLMAFDSNSLKDFFEQRGLQLFSREDGKVFPATYSARDVLEVLLGECEKQGIQIRYGCGARGIELTPSGRFKLSTQAGEINADYLVIAAGGKSYQETGSSGDGYFLAEMLGHSIVSPRPALTSVSIKDFTFSDLAGISLKEAEVTLWRNQKKVTGRREDLLFTHEGFSGPSILHLSREAEPEDIIKVNISGLPREKLEARLIELFTKEGKKLVKTALNSLLDIPDRLLTKIVEISGLAQRSCSELKKEERKALVRNLFESSFVIEKIGDFSQAMVTRGGVSLSEVNPKTMESRLVANLFFSGEVLDFDGETGGYNLQAAFSTGYLAGKTIKGKTSREGNQ